MRRFNERHKRIFLFIIFGKYEDIEYPMISASSRTGNFVVMKHNIYNCIMAITGAILCEHVCSAGNVWTLWTCVHRV